MDTQANRGDLPTHEANLSYPRALACLALGTDDYAQVVQRVTDFAKTYDDTESQLENIDLVVRAVWALSLDDKIIQRSVARKLDGLAYEMLGASVNWYVNHGIIAPEAAVIWTARLSSDPKGEGMGFSNAVLGLCDYVVALDERNIAELGLLRVRPKTINASGPGGNR